MSDLTRDLAALLIIIVFKLEKSKSRVLPISLGTIIKLEEI